MTQFKVTKYAIIEDFIYSEHFRMKANDAFNGNERPCWDNARLSLLMKNPKVLKVMRVVSRDKEPQIVQKTDPAPFGEKVSRLKCSIWKLERPRSSRNELYNKSERFKKTSFSLHYLI